MKQSKKAKFTIVDNTNGKVILSYEFDYQSPKELNTLIQESRQVWSEYEVQVDNDSFTQTFSHTYSGKIAKFTCAIIFLCLFSFFVNAQKPIPPVYVEYSKNISLKKIFDSSVINGVELKKVPENTKISLNEQKIVDFKKAYTEAVKSSKSVFYYEGYPINVKYADYIIHKYEESKKKTI